MKMRKFLVLALALIMIFSLVACKPPVDTEDPNSGDTDPIETPPVTDDPSVTDDTSDTSTEGDETDEPTGPEFTEVNEIVYVYGTNELKVREIPSTLNNEPVAFMKEGEQVTRIGYNAEWSMISYKGETRYAHSDYLTTHAPLEFEDKTDTVYIIAEGTLYLREKPSPNADAVVYLPYGTELDRTGIATERDEFGTEWSRLLYNGEVCYANTSYLSETKPQDMPEEGDFTVVNEYVYVETVHNGVAVEDGINLRTLPTLASESKVLYTAAPGTKLLRIGIAKEADEEGIVWSKVIYNNQTCYASSGWLTTEAPVADDDTTGTTDAEG